MRVALFGGSGFIGREVASLLGEKHVDVLQVSRSAKGANGFTADIAEKGSLDKLKGQFDAAIICSALLPKKTYDDNDAVRYLRTNTEGPLNVAAWCRTNGVPRVIYCSTLSMLPSVEARERGELVDTSSHYMYKVSKAAGEHLLTGFCREHGIAMAILRVAAVYGTGMPAGIIQLIIDKIERGEKFVLQNSHLSADFIHVKDVAAVIVACVGPKSPIGVINVCSARPIAIFDLAALLSKLMGGRILEIEVADSTTMSPPIHSNAEALSLLGRPMTELVTGLNEILTAR
jgi:nucleoside-diphosphate-sugar epimerase